MHLPHLAQRFFDTPHLVTASRLAVLERFLVGRFDLPLVLDTSAQDRFDDAQEGSCESQPLSRSVDGVTVIDIFGTLVQRSGGMDALSGLTSYSGIRGELEMALADQATRCIVLNIDSPGGEVAGCFELADRIRAATADMPIIAYAHDLAASAAYALAAACSEIYLPESGVVGSIGVVMAHIDQSAADAAEGIKVTHLFSGSHKVDGNPHEPLGGPARLAMQAQIDQLAGIFRAKVAAFRGLTPEAVAATEAGIYIGASAVAAGLADGVLSDDAVLGLALTGGTMSKPRLEGAPQASTTTTTTDAAPPPPAPGTTPDTCGCGCSACAGCTGKVPMSAETVAKSSPAVAAALRAEGVTQERGRIAGLLALVKHPSELSSALAAINSGEDRGALAEKLLDQQRQARGQHIATVGADLAAIGRVPAQPAAPPVPENSGLVVVNKGDDTKTVEAKCKVAWDSDQSIRAKFGIGGFRGFVGWNKVAAKGGTVNGIGVGR